MQPKGKTKISTIILIGYLSLVFLFFGSFIFSSQKKKKGKEITYQLPSFKYIRIGPGGHIRVVTGKENNIGFWCKSNDYHLNDFWKINGDTLVVFKFPKYVEQLNYAYQLSVKDIVKIDANNGDCIICMSGDSIELRGVNHSSFAFERPHNFEKIKLYLNNSSFSCSGQFLNKMDIAMSDSSMLHFPGGREVRISSDSTSRIVNW